MLQNSTNAEQLKIPSSFAESPAPRQRIHCVLLWEMLMCDRCAVWCLFSDKAARGAEMMKLQRAPEEGERRIICQRRMNNALHILSLFH